MHAIHSIQLFYLEGVRSRTPSLLIQINPPKELSVKAGSHALWVEGAVSALTMFSGLTQYLVVTRTNESGGFHASDSICLPSCTFHSSAGLLLVSSTPNRQLAIEIKDT